MKNSSVLSILCVVIGISGIVVENEITWAVAMMCGVVGLLCDTIEKAVADSSDPDDRE